MSGAIVQLSAKEPTPSTRRRHHLAHATPLHVTLDEGKGPAVVLVHGIASSPVTFQNVIPLLRPDHRLVAVDLLGFGQSPAPEGSDYSIEEHVRCLEATFERLRLPKKSVLVGHSMGALISARLAAKDPRRVHSLVLVSPPIYLPPEQLSRPADRRVMDLHLAAYRFVRANPTFTLRAARALSELLPIKGALTLDERGWTAFARSLKQCIESQTALDDLAQVTAPVDLIVGTLDEFASEEVLRIVSRLRGITTHRVRGSDHLIGRRLARVVAEAVRAADAPQQEHA